MYRSGERKRGDAVCARRLSSACVAATVASLPFPDCPRARGTDVGDVKSLPVVMDVALLILYSTDVAGVVWCVRINGGGFGPVEG